MHVHAHVHNVCTHVILLCVHTDRLLHQPEGSRIRSSVMSLSEKTICVQLLTILHRVVFRGRGRYVDEDFDLDLTYITERIIGEYIMCLCMCYHEPR